MGAIGCRKMHHPMVRIRGTACACFEMHIRRTFKWGVFCLFYLAKPGVVCGITLVKPASIINGLEVI